MKFYYQLAQTKSIVSHLRFAIAAALLILGTVMFSVALNNTAAGAAGGGSGSGTAQTNPSTDAVNQGPTVDTSSAIVQLKGDPLSTYSATKPAHGKKIDFNSNTVKSYRAQLAALRDNFKQWLQTYAPNAQITGQYDISLNAVAVQLNGTSLDTIAR